MIVTKAGGWLLHPKGSGTKAQTMGIALMRNSSNGAISYLEYWLRVSHEDHTHDTPLAGRATPQGCPLVPLTLAMWVTAGVRFVRVSFDHPLQHFAYMDDLNFDFQSLDGN